MSTATTAPARRAGLFTCGITSIFAIFLGHASWKDTKSGRRGGHGLTVAGLIIGYLTGIPWLIVIAMMLGGMAIAPIGLLPLPTPTP